MPCNSKIQTVLLDLATIEAAANALGIQVIKHTPNSYTLKSKTESVTIERLPGRRKFTTTYFSAQGDLLKTLVPEYAKQRIKAWGKSKGYTLATDSTNPRKFVLTKYS